MRTVRLGSRSAQHPLSRDRVSSPVSDEAQRAERTTTMRTLRPMPAGSVMVFRARAELDAVGAESADSVEIKRDLLLPAEVAGRVAGAAVLVGLPEAAVGD